MNAVFLQFANGRTVSGHGYRILMQAMFKPGTTTDDIVFFLFGTLVDAQASDTDWLLETLRAIKCQEALLFKLVPGAGGSRWTAVRYSNILTENPDVTELPDAGELYRYKICAGEQETESDDDLPREPELPGIVSRVEGGVRPPGSPGLLKSVGRALHRWAFGGASSQTEGTEMMRIEDLQIGEWYVVLTNESRLCGAPLRVQEISPPFVLAIDFMDDMVVVDSRVEKIGTVTPSYVRKFRRLWKKQVARKKEEEEAERTRSVECDGIDISALMEDPEE